LNGHAIIIRSSALSDSHRASILKSPSQLYQAPHGNPREIPISLGNVEDWHSRRFEAAPSTSPAAMDATPPGLPPAAGKSPPPTRSLKSRSPRSFGTGERHSRSYGSRPRRLSPVVPVRQPPDHGQSAPYGPDVAAAVGAIFSSRKNTLGRDSFPHVARLRRSTEP